MKIGGDRLRIIQNKNITKNDKYNFSATYRKHYIEVHLFKEVPGENPHWNVEIYHFDGGAACDTIVQRCNIKDAISYGLDGAML